MFGGIHSHSIIDDFTPTESLLQMEQTCSVRRAIQAYRLEAREPIGVRLGGGGDALCAEKVAESRVATKLTGGRTGGAARWLYELAEI
jgi:hypothetical protein